MNLSVSALVKYLKNKLDNDTNLQNIVVKGELSNFHIHSSGHLYFTLKDDKAAISCVMFASKASRVSFKPKNGDKVELTANTSIFEITGQLQLYVNTLKLAGIGDLYQQYEELKAKLNKEGYFDQDHKKDLEIIYPEKIAVLVGENSAAMSDIVTCFSRRWPICKVDYYPCLVQGKSAPLDIVTKLKEIDDLSYDLIILARGGGSFEDLFCFNDENLVKTIYNLNTFIVTGVGHEQDYTLVDFVSDLRAPTPTAAVELITPNINDVIIEIENYKKSLKNSIDAFINDNKELLNKYKSSKIINNPMLIIQNNSLKFDYFNASLSHFSSIIDNYNISIASLKKQMNVSIKGLLSNTSNLLKRMNILLDAYSNENILSRGYTLVFKDDKVIKSKKLLKENDIVNICFKDGSLKAKIGG